MNQTESVRCFAQYLQRNPPSVNTSLSDLAERFIQAQQLPEGRFPLEMAAEIKSTPPVR